MSDEPFANDTAFERLFGIRMQTTRSRPPKNRWSRQWQNYMESLHMGARMGRGRQYATGGNIRNLKIEAGLVSALVKGGAPEPYHCKITCETPDAATAKKIADSLCCRPMLLARLLIGDLPDAVDTRFRAEGVPIEPSEVAPLAAHCSCPDGATFCKHSAALLFLLGEIFDNNPLLLLKFRGIDKSLLFGEEGLNANENHLTANNAEAANSKPLPHSKSASNATNVTFQNYKAKFPESTPLSSESLFDFPGPLPFWRGETRFADAIQECLSRASSAANNKLNDFVNTKKL